MSRIEVDALALRQVLEALSGPSHFIRELQATRNLPFSTNPIDILIAEFNAAVSDPKECGEAEAHPARCGCEEQL